MPRIQPNDPESQPAAAFGDSPARQATPGAAAPASGAVASPYTDPGDRARDVVNSTEAAEIRGLDRKLTDGLNLVYGQLAVLRDERREDRREFREFRQEVREQGKEFREDRKELKAELRAEIAKVDNRVAGLETAIRAEIAKVDDRAGKRGKELETAIRAEIAKVDDRAGKRGKELETAIRELTAKVSTALERSWGTRRLVWGVVGALSLLVVGAAIRPLFERVVAALLGG